MAKDPKKINSILCFDFETGGLDCKKNPITEFAGILLNGATLEEMVRYDNLVKPYDNSLIYEAKAAELTGITREMCEKQGIPLKQLVDDIISLFEEGNSITGKFVKVILVAHNSPFDIPFLIEIFRRAGKDLSKYVVGSFDSEGNFIPYQIDTIADCKRMWGDITESDTKFTLEACCEKAGIQLYDAHRAINDTSSLADLYRYITTRMRTGGTEVSVQDGVVSKHRIKFEW